MFDTPDLDAEPQLVAPAGPDIDPQMFADTAKELFGIKVGVRRRTGPRGRALGPLPSLVVAPLGTTFRADVGWRSR